MGCDRDIFLNQERLSSFVLADLQDILPSRERRIVVPPTKLRHTAERLVGRDVELTMLDDAWNDPHTNVVVVRGKGGEGKTSLVATWMAELALKDWRDAELVLDWSFYSQGTRDQASATAELFINQALTHLGDPDPYAGGPEDRAARLVALIGSRRSLLVLDGLEPLQYPPGPMHGALKDPGMAALLRGLVANNQGLCVVTTREKVDEIKQHYGRSAVDHDLQFLSPLAGAQLLHNSGACRAGARQIEPDDEELQGASREVRGHALTLSLVGQYLHLTEDGDIRHRDRMKLAEADQEHKNDATRPYGHAFKAIEAYETWFAAGDIQARRQLFVLRLLGLFDRVASADCLAALRAAPVIKGLNDDWQDTSDKDWKLTVNRLQEINLIGLLDAGDVDCHPLIREYFAEQLKEKNRQAFESGHSRLFDHLCETTEHQPDTLPGLQPLYQAVAHGCLAGRQQEACYRVYKDRILRRNEYYSSQKLGAIGMDLGAIAAFFDTPWQKLSPSLSEEAQALLLNSAALRLRALGRLTEAREPLRKVTEMTVRLQDWRNAAIDAGNLSELEVTLGLLDEAASDGRRAIELADRTDGHYTIRSNRCKAADAMHQRGDRDEAQARFEEAERMQVVRQPQFPLLYSTGGFRYADVILAPVEPVIWQVLDSRGSLREPTLDRGAIHDFLAACTEAQRRATQTLEWATPQNWLLDIALDHLTLARAHLYRAVLEADFPAEAALKPAATELDRALRGLRQANEVFYLPKGVLTAALLDAVRGEACIPSALEHLAEAQQIAERGPMPLFLADVHLHRARIMAGAASLSEAARSQCRAELAAARALIEKHKYGRRAEELADAERFLA